VYSVSRVSAGQSFAVLSGGVVTFSSMTEFSRNQGHPQPHGGHAHPGSSGSQAWLLSEWTRDNSPLLMFGALVLVVVLWLAAQVITWPAVVSVLAAAGASAAWTWYLTARRRGAAEATRKQREVFVQSCFDKVDVMPGSPVFERYIGPMTRRGGCVISRSRPQPSARRLPFTCPPPS